MTVNLANSHWVPSPKTSISFSAHAACAIVGNKYIKHNTVATMILFNNFDIWCVPPFGSRPACASNEKLPSDGASTDPMVFSPNKKPLELNCYNLLDKNLVRLYQKCESVARKKSCHRHPHPVGLHPPPLSRGELFCLAQAREIRFTVCDASPRYRSAWVPACAGMTGIWNNIFTY